MKAKRFFPTAAFLFCIAAPLLFTACQQPAANPDAANEALVKPMTEMALDIWNNGNMAQLENMFNPDFIRHESGVDLKGAEAFKTSYENTKKIYPDLKISIKDAWVKGDKMTLLWNATATNAGPFGEGMPATGKPVSVDGVDILLLKGGKVSEQWVFFDQANVFAQLGYTFQPPATASTTTEPAPAK